MSKFKIGDKVKLIRNSDNKISDLKEGDTGVVIKTETMGINNFEIITVENPISHLKTIIHQDGVVKCLNWKERLSK